MKERRDHYYDVGSVEKTLKKKRDDARQRKELRMELCSGDLEAFDDLSESGNSPEYIERVKDFKRSLFTFINSARQQHGIGSNNEFFVVGNPGEEVSHVATEELGVRRILQVRKWHPKAKEFYMGIPSLPGQPRPLDDFIHGIEVQTLAHEKGLNVPFVCSVVQIEGAQSLGKDPKSEIMDGDIIEGTEKTVVDIMAVMEKINGITFEQLCDPGHILRNAEKNHKNGYQIRKFFQDHAEEVESNIVGAIENGYRYILDWDFDTLTEKISRQIEWLHTADEEFPAILHNDLHAGNIVIRADGKPFLIDFDLAKVVDAEIGEETGTELEDYRDIGKTVGERNVFYLADSYDKEKVEDRTYMPMSALEQIAIYIGFVKSVVEKYKQNNGSYAIHGSES
ncbi:MAG: phosphotransferase [Candidatus Moraniibacteriota bacterium]